MQTLTAPTAPSGYRTLCDQVRSAGLLDRRRRWYGTRVPLTVVAFLGGWVLLYVIGDSWLAVLDAVLLTLLATHVVFLGHDAGHQQIARTVRCNRMLGLLLGNALTGLSFGWWVPKHNAHHAHPNQLGLDPDIAPGPVAFTADAAAERSGLTRWVMRWQALTFFPLLLLEGVSLQLAGLRNLGKRRDRRAVAEGLLLVGHFIGYVVVLLMVMSPTKVLVFVAVEQGLFGLYLGATFAPNHKGMALIERESTVCFAHRQVLTSRNVTTGRLATFALGGLNYQIEHHLFPTMPRPNLPHAQAFVRRYCETEGLPYRQDSVLGSYRQALRHLHHVGQGLPLTVS